MVGTKMELNTMSEANKSKVLKRLKSLDDTDRMLLMNKYTRQTENVYCTFGVERNIEIITKIFMFKFNKDALIDAYVKGDPVVDVQGNRLNDFLDNELLR